MVKDFTTGNAYMRIERNKLVLDIAQYPREIIYLHFAVGTRFRYYYVGSGWHTWVTTSSSGITIQININQQVIQVDSTTYQLSALSYARYEIVGNIDSVGIRYDDSNNFKYLTSVTIDNPVEFHLYNVSGKFNDAQKSLNNEKEYFGVFKEETDVLNPVILIESDTFITSNYAFITPYNRYYFITDITCVRKNLYRLSLKVDVLKTWYRNIRDDSEGLIVRSANSEVFDNAELVDERLPLKDIPQFEIVRTSNAGGVRNVSFRPDLISQNYYYIAVTVMNDTQRTTTGNSRQRPTNTGLQYISGYVIDNPTLVTYFLDRDKFEKLAYRIENKQSLGTFIVSIVYFPFDVAQIDGERDADNNLKTKVVRINNEDISSTFAPLGEPMETYYSYSNVSSYLVISDQTYDSSLIPHLKTQTGLTFLNYEPYSTYQIYIPYHGWEDVRGYDIVNQRILTFYVADYSSGMARWYLYNETKRYLITSGNCELGSRVAISATNMYELINQKLQNTSNTMLATIGSVVTTGVGIATNNPVMISGGIIGGASALTGGFNKNNMLLGQGNISSGGDSFGYYSNNMSYVKHTYRDMLDNFDYTEYINDNGLPVNQFSLFNEYGDNEMEGYIEITHFHMNVSFLSITKTETDEIESLLKTGVYL